MLRITQVGSGPETCLRIEGRITKETLGELARFSESYLTSSTLDLSGVTFVDLASVERLRELSARGAVLDGCSGFVSQLLDRPETATAGAELSGSSPPATTTGAEGDFIAHLRAGDEDAFAALVRREAGRMLATAKRMLGTDQDAQDAVQEAFLHAHRAIGRFAGDSRLSTWLHRIVVNASLMKLRTRRRKPEQSIDELLPHFDESGAWLRPVSEWERPSEELLESVQCRAMVRGAIERLPESYRQVLMLRDIEGFDTEEASEMLGTTTNAVKVRLHRARQALRTLLEPELSASAHPGS